MLDHDGGITIASRCRNIYKFAIRAYNMGQYRKALRYFNHILFMETEEDEEFANEIKYYIRRLHSIIQDGERPEDIFKPPERPDPDLDLDDLDLDRDLSKTPSGDDEPIDELDEIIEEIITVDLDEMEARPRAKKINIKVPKDRPLRFQRPTYLNNPNPYQNMGAPRMSKKEVKHPQVIAMCS